MNLLEHAPKRTRRKREQVRRRSDGRMVTITKPPRADILWYPAARLTTVLVRRTHNLNLARQLADERWAALGTEAPLTSWRTGWWRTYSTSKGPVAQAAEDQHGRVVQWCTDTEHAAGPGIEFRP